MVTWGCIVFRTKLHLYNNTVAHKTAAVINDVTKSHIHEPADVHSIVDRENPPENYITTSLESLAFTMSSSQFY